MLYLSGTELGNAWELARERIKAAGLWLRCLRKVDVSLTYIPSPYALGYYWYGYSAIRIPQLALGRLCSDFESSVVGVLVHEIGHAIDDLANLRNNATFYADFGRVWGHRQKYRRSDHITPYAATYGCEDFAECYLHLVSTQCRISRKLPRKVRDKLRLVRAVVRENQ